MMNAAMFESFVHCTFLLHMQKIKKSLYMLVYGVYAYGPADAVQLHI